MASIEPSFSVTDDRFSVNDLTEKELILEFQLSKFVFIVKCLKSGEIQWLEEYDTAAKSIDAIISSHPFLAANFWNKIKAVFHADVKTIVPKVYFDSYEKSELLPEAISNQTEGTLQDWKISPESYLIYNISNTISSVLQATYPEKEVNLIPMDICLPKTVDGYCLFLEKNNFTIQLIEKGDPQSSEAYYFENFEHFKDIILALNMDFNKNLQLSGETTTYSKYYRWMQQQFVSISFEKRLFNVKLSQYFTQLPKHKFITILNASSIF